MIFNLEDELDRELYRQFLLWQEGLICHYCKAEELHDSISIELGVCKDCRSTQVQETAQ